MIYTGKEFGVYAAPFIIKRFGSKDKTYPVMYGYTDTGKFMGLNGTFTIGLKLGFYLASEEKKGNVYIHL